MTTFPPPPDADRLAALYVAANRSAAYGMVLRWGVHQIRNPIQALSLITELLGDGDAGGLDASLHEAVTSGLAALAGASAVLDDASRIVQPGLLPEPLVIEDVLQALGRLLAIHRSPVHVTLRTEGTLPAVRGVPEHVQHALLNLVLNAVEALGEQEDGRIAVSAAPAAGGVAVTVADNGPGVAPEVRDALFTPFVSTRTRRLVPGLGLAVARMLCEDAGGSVTYAGAGLDGRGATFVATFAGWR